MKAKAIFALLILALAACAPAVTPAVSNMDIQNTAIAAAWTSVTLTPIAPPTAMSVPPTVTPMDTIVVIPATPPPAQPPIPILTPDAIQMERWKEYQTELAKALLSFPPPERRYDPEEYKNALCEWDILGRSGQEVYVWADCVSADGLVRRGNPAAIYLEPDGSIREVSVARAGADPRTQFAVYDLHLFPIYIQEKLCLYYFFGTVPQCGSIIPNYLPGNGLSSRERVLISHLEYRKGHAEEPPLVVLSAMPTAIPTP